MQNFLQCALDPPQVAIGTIDDRLQKVSYVGISFDHPNIDNDEWSVLQGGIDDKELEYPNIRLLTTGVWPRYCLSKTLV
jgi:hypothetical protein